MQILIHAVAWFEKAYMYEASTPSKWSISVILTFLCYDFRGEEDSEEKLFAEAQQRKYVPSLTQQAPVNPPHPPPPPQKMRVDENDDSVHPFTCL